MRSPLFIGIDIGTQGTKAVLCDDSGKIYADAFCPSQLLYGKDNSISQSPEDIYSSVITVIKALTEQSGPDADRITALAIDSQMAGILGVDEAYEPVTPYDSWLDGRCGKYAQQIKAEAEEAAVTASGGQVINSSQDPLVEKRGAPGIQQDQKLCTAQFLCRGEAVRTDCPAGLYRLYLPPFQ